MGGAPGRHQRRGSALLRHRDRRPRSRGLPRAPPWPPSRARRRACCGAAASPCSGPWPREARAAIGRRPRASARALVDAARDTVVRERRREGRRGHAAAASIAACVRCPARTSARTWPWRCGCWRRRARPGSPWTSAALPRAVARTRWPGRLQRLPGRPPAARRRRAQPRRRARPGRRAAGRAGRSSSCSRPWPTRTSRPWGGRSFRSRDEVVLTRVAGRAPPPRRRSRGAWARRARRAEAAATVRRRWLARGGWPAAAAWWWRRGASTWRARCSLGGARRGEEAAEVGDRFRRVPLRGPEERAHQRPVAGDQERLRIAGGAIGGGGVRAGVAQDREAQAVAGHEVAQGRLVFVHGDAEDDEALPAQRAVRRSSDGISATQGGHQVAQKFTSTTRPRSEARSLVPPASAGRRKSGTARPARGRALPLLERDEAERGAAHDEEDGRELRDLLHRRTGPQ